MAWCWANYNRKSLPSIELTRYAPKMALPWGGVHTLFTGQFKEMHQK